VTAQQDADLLGTTMSQTVITVPVPPVEYEKPLPIHHTSVWTMILVETL